MSQQVPQPDNEPVILGRFASLLGLLGVALYFTGWIYRWAYYGFFQVEVSTLDLPLESFLMVPLQVFFGDSWAVSKTVLAFVIAVILIKLTIWLVQLPKSKAASSRNQLLTITQKFRQSLHRLLESIFPQPLLNEIVIVVWVLTVLFCLAKLQGTIDARRDAVNNTSLLPIVTLVTQENQLGLGRKLEDLLTNPSLKGYRIIGNKVTFDKLRGRETNDTANPVDPIVWRLLIERGGWIYLFQSLPPNAPHTNRPYILVVRESDGGDQLLILGGNDSQGQNTKNSQKN
jgi:cell division protein ZapA (FtsZ GTPase activity inhibitor)